MASHAESKARNPRHMKDKVLCLLVVVLLALAYDMTQDKCGEQRPASLPKSIVPTVATVPQTCLDIQLTADPDKRRVPSITNVQECLLYEPPSAYIDLLKQTLVGLPSQGTCGGRNCAKHLPYKHELRKYGHDCPPLWFYHGGTNSLGKLSRCN